MFNLQRIDSEITNKCNAACPLCPRTGKDGKPHEVITRNGLLDLDLKHIDNILLSNNGQNINSWTYCGNFGDPLMHDHALTFAQTVSEYGVRYQEFSSNGAMRSPKWWAELGRVPGVCVNFAIDGLEDTNHIYRVKTKWANIMANAEAFINAGGKALWTMLIFEHNEHQVDQCREFAKKMGFAEFLIKISTRKVIDQKQPDVQAKQYDFQLSKKINQNATIAAPIKNKFRPEAVNKGIERYPVKCMAIQKRQMYITPEGWIIPCCHVHSGMHRDAYGIAKAKDKFLEILDDNNVKYKLDNHSFDDIVASYRENIKVFELHWDKRLVPVCNRKCGSNLGNQVKRYE